MDPDTASDAIAEDWHAALAALAWQVDLGVIDALEEAPVDRYALTEATRPTPARASAAAPHAAPVAAPAAVADPAAAARTLAEGAATLDDLQEVLSAFDLCDLKQGAKRTILGDGHAAARVLILGDAPTREDETEARAFAGEAGRMLDRMFAAIGLSRGAPDPAAAIRAGYLMPWRPPGTGDLDPDDVAMMLPFAQRHVALVDPAVVVVVGPAAAAALTGQRFARGQWATALGRPALCMLHPAHLLRVPLAKRDAWNDLLTLKDRLAAG